MKLYKEESYYIAHLRINNWKQSFRISHAMNVIDLPIVKKLKISLLGEFDSSPEIESTEFDRIRFYYDGYTMKIKWQIKHCKLIKELYYNIRYKLERW